MISFNNNSSKEKKLCKFHSPFRLLLKHLHEPKVHDNNNGAAEDKADDVERRR